MEDFNDRMVEAVLEEIYELEELRYYGDYTASVILRDFTVALSLAELTERQAECLRLVYSEGMTHGEAAIRLQIERSTVSHALLAAIRKIAMIYTQWEGNET